MIKLKQLMGATLFIALMASCNSSGNKDPKNANNGTSSGSDISEDDANKIINYTNAVIDVLKVHQDAIHQAVKDYQEVEDDINDQSKNGMDFYMHGSTALNVMFVDFRKGPIAFGEPTSALGKDKAFFADSVKAYKTLFDKFKAQNTELDLYMKGKDYKDDNFAKGKDLINKQYTLYDQLTALKRSINAKIEEVADAAEEVSLKDDPLREAYVAAKQDLKKTQELIQYIDGIDNYTDKDVTKIDADYAAIIASIDAHKTIDRAELVKAYKNDSYDRFYASLTEGITELKAHIRDIKANKKLEDTDYESIHQIIKNIVAQYNAWVG